MTLPTTAPADPTHRCRQRHRCVARVRDDDGRWLGGGVDRTDTLCRGCEEAAFAAIRQLYEDWCLLEVAETRSATAGSGAEGDPVDAVFGADPPRHRHPAVRDRGRNPHLGTHTHPQRPAACRARGLCAPMCGDPVDPPRHPRGPAAPAAVADGPRADGGDDLGRVDLDGVDAVLGLAELHRYTQNLLGLIETRIWLPDPCHVCGVKALTSSPDQETVTCQACRSVWGKEEFARLNGVGVLGAGSAA